MRSSVYRASGGDSLFYLCAYGGQVATGWQKIKLVHWQVNERVETGDTCESVEGKQISLLISKVGDDLFKWF